MRTRLFPLALAAFALVAGASANAQDAGKAQDEGAVVVTASKLKPKEVHQYVHQISSAIDGQMTRLTAPVCPLVIGFPEQYNQIIVKRVRQIAADAGVAVANEKCRANVVTIVAADADALVTQLRKKQPFLFEGVNMFDLQAVKRPGPVHAWNTTQLQNEDGQAQAGTVMTVKSASILTLTTQQVILGSMIVIDDDATIGKSLTQIADYIAMRALVGARPPREGLQADTILTLFDPSVAPPPSVTHVDRSYLKGVYESPLNAQATTTMGRISRRIRADEEARREGKVD